MAPAKCTCPYCTTGLRTPRLEELPAKVQCRRCGNKFLLEVDGSVQPLSSLPQGNQALAAVAPPAFAVPQAPFHPPRQHLRAAPPLGEDTGASRTPLLIVVIGAAVLFVGAGIGLAVYCFSGGSEEAGSPRTQAGKDKLIARHDPKDNQVPVPPQDKPTRDGIDKPVDKPQDVRVNPQPIQPRPVQPRPVQPKPLPPKPLADPVKPLPKEDQDKVDRALERGVAYLKASLDDNNGLGKDSVLTVIGPVDAKHPGAMALAGLTLLACGVPAKDPAVVKVINKIRAEGPRFTNTYMLSLSILFLDRLGAAEDRKLIQTMALRLVAGQNARGAWCYSCPVLTAADQENLLKLLQALARGDKNELAGLEALSARYKGLPVLKYQLGQAVDNSLAAALTVDFNPRYDDNSNTQFAILALWAAQKTGIPVDQSLAMVEARFRATQNADGSWGYNNSNVGTWLDSMTCAGLLGLATGQGTRKLESQGGKGEKPARGLKKDPQVQKALQYLSRTVGKPAVHGQAHPNGARGFRLFGSTAEEDVFFLWSLERMSVIYRLQKVGDKEWYPWGAKLLVDSQRADGSWMELYGTVPNTCFALLFLKRVNVAQDLTSKLQLLENAATQPTPNQRKE